MLYEVLYKIEILQIHKIHKVFQTYEIYYYMHRTRLQDTNLEANWEKQVL